MRKLTIMLWAIFGLAFTANASNDALPSDTLANSLSVGQTATNFTLPDAYGNNVSLHDELKKGPVILSFYRGGWCPVCNIQLNSFQESLPLITELGAQLIAISPQIPSKSELTQVKNQLTYTVLSDVGNKVADRYGIVWNIPEEDRTPFNQWLLENSGMPLSDFNNSDSFNLPVPATFVINTDKTVIYAFKDVDYKNRANINDIIHELEKLD